MHARCGYRKFFSIIDLNEKFGACPAIAPSVAALEVHRVEVARGINSRRIPLLYLVM
jgi:hypothetical protein